MLISRCAWHRRYHGYTKILGISSWRGLQPSFTDGICHKCAARVRADHLRARYDRGASADRREHAWLPGLAAASLATVVALVLIARPTHELPPVSPVVAVLPPPAAVEAPATVATSTEVEPPPVREVSPPRRERTVAAREAVHRERPVPRPAVAPVRFAWAHPSALARVSVPVSWGSSPYRSLTPRESTTQSP
jgi:hypothetical protein